MGVVRLYDDIAVSPDGQRMAIVEIVREDAASGRWLRYNLIVANIDGTNAAVVDSVPTATGRLSQVSWSPDGGVLTYIRARADADATGLWKNTAEHRIRVLNADGSAGRSVLRSTTLLEYPTFSHDGQRIIYTRNAESGRTLRITGLDGTNDTELVRAEVDPGRAVRADRGEYFLFNAEAVNADGSLNKNETRRVIAAVKADGTGLVQALAWPGTDPVSLITLSLSANSSRIAIEGIAGFISGHAWQSMGISQGTGEIKWPASRSAFSMLPDGSAIMFCGGLVQSDTIYRVPLKGDPVPIALQRVNIDDVARGVPPDETDISEAVPEGTRQIGEVAISPDARRVVFSWAITEGDGAGTTELWLMNTDGTNPVRLTEGAVDTRPRFSPSGTTVIFERLVAGSAQHDVWTTELWAGEAKAVIATDADETQPTFGAADNAFIFCRAAAGKPEEMALMRSVDGVETTIAGAQFGPSHPTFVADVDATFFSSKAIDAGGAVIDGKRHVAFVSGADATPRSWRSSNGTPADLLGFRCSGDGSRVLTVMQADERDYLFFEEQSLLGSNSGAVGKVTSFTSYDVSRDGTRFVFVGTTTEDAVPGVWVVNWDKGQFVKVMPGVESSDVRIEPPATPRIATSDADAIEEPLSKEQVSNQWGFTELVSPALSPDGTRLAVIEESYEGGALLGSALVTAELDGTDVRTLVSGEQVLRPRWSSDGARIVFEMTPAGEADSEVFMVDADGANLTRLTTNDVFDSEPTFTWDDAGVVFVRREAAGAGGALVERTRATGAERVLLGAEFDVAFPVAWQQTRSLIFRMKPVDENGAIKPGAAGYVMATLQSDKAVPVFSISGEDEFEWPQSLRVAKDKVVYIVQLGEDRGTPGPVILMDEAVSTTAGVDVPQCIAGSDAIDITADGKTLVFYGVRDEEDQDERPGVWIVGADGRNARLFSLRRSE